MSGWWYQLVILVIGGMWWNLNNMWVVTICYNAFFLILIHTAKVSCLFTGSLFWVPCELPSHWGHSKTVDRVNGSGFERFKPNPRWTKRWTVDHRGPVDVPRPDQAQGGCTWYTGTLVHRCRYIRYTGGIRGTLPSVVHGPGSQQPGSPGLEPSPTTRYANCSWNLTAVAWKGRWHDLVTNMTLQVLLHRKR